MGDFSCGVINCRLGEGSEMIKIANIHFVSIIATFLIKIYIFISMDKLELYIFSCSKRPTRTYRTYSLMQGRNYFGPAQSISYLKLFLI